MMPKLRIYQIEIFTGSAPDSLTNTDGDELFEWLASKEEEELHDLTVESVGDEMWFIVEYTEG